MNTAPPPPPLPCNWHNCQPLPSDPKWGHRKPGYTICEGHFQIEAKSNRAHLFKVSI